MNIDSFIILENLGFSFTFEYSLNSFPPVEVADEFKRLRIHKDVDTMIVSGIYCRSVNVEKHGEITFAQNGVAITQDGISKMAFFVSGKLVFSGELQELVSLLLVEIFYVATKVILNKNIHISVTPKNPTEIKPLFDSIVEHLKKDLLPETGIGENNDILFSLHAGKNNISVSVDESDILLTFSGKTILSSQLRNKTIRMLTWLSGGPPYDICT